MADDIDVLGGVSRELKKIEESVSNTHSELKQAVTRQEKEMTELGGTSVETKKRIETLEARYDQEAADIRGLVASLGDDYKELKTFYAEWEENQKERQIVEAKSGKNMEEVFAKADGWKDYNVESKRDSPQIDLGSFEDYRREQKWTNVITGGAAALDNVFGRTEWAGIYGLPFMDTVHLRDYMRVERASGASIAYVERTAYDMNAAVQSAPGELKAQSEMTFTEREAKAVVLAHGADITKQQARQTPFITNYVQTELLEGLKHQETYEILFADGTAGRFEGIFNHDRVLTFVPADEDAQPDDTAIDYLRRSENLLGDNYLVGDLYVMNHRDWTNIELLKDNEGQYLWTSVQDGGTARMWRKPVLTTRAMPRGQFINGCFRTCATLLDFQRASVQLFPQHSDYARRNLVYILAEEFIGLAVTMPQGFVLGAMPGYSIGSGS